MISLLNIKIPAQVAKTVWPDNGPDPADRKKYLGPAAVARLGMDMGWMTPQNWPKYTGLSPAAKIASIGP